MPATAIKAIWNQTGQCTEYTAHVAVLWLVGLEDAPVATNVSGKMWNNVSKHPLTNEIPMSAAPSHLRVEVFMRADDA
jgi:hypothetical protein